jgi:hypothetical protein
MLQNFYFLKTYCFKGKWGGGKAKGYNDNFMDQHGLFVFIE